MFEYTILSEKKHAVDFNNGKTLSTSPAPCTEGVDPRRPDGLSVSKIMTKFVQIKNR